MKHVHRQLVPIAVHHFFTLTINHVECNNYGFVLRTLYDGSLAVKLVEK